MPYVGSGDWNWSLQTCVTRGLKRHLFSQIPHLLTETQNSDFPINSGVWKCEYVHVHICEHKCVVCVTLQQTLDKHCFHSLINSPKMWIRCPWWMWWQWHFNFIILLLSRKPSLSIEKTAARILSISIFQNTCLELLMRCLRNWHSPEITFIWRGILDVILDLKKISWKLRI